MSFTKPKKFSPIVKKSNGPLSRFGKEFRSFLIVVVLFSIIIYLPKFHILPLTVLSLSFCIFPFAVIILSHYWANLPNFQNKILLYKNSIRGSLNDICLAC